MLGFTRLALTQAPLLGGLGRGAVAGTVQAKPFSHAGAGVVIHRSGQMEPTPTSLYANYGQAQSMAAATRNAANTVNTGAMQAEAGAASAENAIAGERLTLARAQASESIAKQGAQGIASA